jgi:hypothetical protein
MVTRLTIAMTTRVAALVDQESTGSHFARASATKAFCAHRDQAPVSDGDASDPAGTLSHQCAHRSRAPLSAYVAIAPSLWPPDPHAAAAESAPHDDKQVRRAPIHPSVVHELAAYAARRDRSFVQRKSDAFFLSRRATSLKYQRVTATFRRLRRQLGWTTPPLPRLHDLRHTVAVKTLIRWCTAGEDVDKKILALTTYLGHVFPNPRGPL